MAKQLVTTLICDETGASSGEAEVRRVEFGFQGNSHEVDLVETKARQLEDTLAHYAQIGRRVKSQRSAEPEPLVRGALTKQRDSRRQWLADARALLRKEGYAVSDRGRVPVELEALARKWIKEGSAPSAVHHG